MSVTGFLVNGQVQKYDYESLDNLPDDTGAGSFPVIYNVTTASEITQALNKNQIPILKDPTTGSLYYLNSSAELSGNRMYIFVSNQGNKMRQVEVIGNTWGSFSDTILALNTSPTFQGVPKAPTASTGTNNTQLATTAFVHQEIMYGALSENLKQALLQIASKVAYIDTGGQTYYDDLENALYPHDLLGIEATFTQGSAIIYDTDSLNNLKQYLTVVATYSGGDTETLSDSDYTLSGNLLSGVSEITVEYEGFTDTFDVVVTHMAGYYTIVNNLTGCTTNNSATSIQENTTYTATITASVGYTLSGATATITMGGNILTGVFSNGTISIPSVTGDLVITVVASAITVSSISAVYTSGQDTPKTIDPTRINSYINASGNWVSSSDSYSICIPVTTGRKYNLHFSTTDSSLVGTIFRYGFSESNTPVGQGLSGLARTTPQDLSDSNVIATGPYLIIQLSAATASSVFSNEYLTLTELARDIYATDTLDSIKPNLVVTATYSDNSTAVVPAADYTLSGTLAVGTSTITVNYGGKTTTFNVTVSDTELVSWSYTDGLPSDNGFIKTTSGTVTETIETNDLRLNVSGGNGSGVRYEYDYTPTSAVLEARFKPTGNNFFYLLAIKDAFAIRCQYSNNYKGFYQCDSTEGIANTTKITDMTVDSEYIVKIVLDNGYADIYINGSIVASHIDISTCVIYNTFTGIRFVAAGSSAVVGYLYSINMELSGGND